MSEVDNRISPSEEVTRYIFDRSAYSPINGRVKYNALLPNSKGETSVYRIINLTRNEIWDIGQRYVAERRGRTLRARGDIGASDIFSESLEIRTDMVIHPLHANVVGWPTQRSEQLLIAKKIADKTQLHLPPKKRGQESG